MKKKSSVSRGIIFVYQCNNKQFKLLNEYDRLLAKRNALFSRKCTPLQVRAMHFCTTSSSFLIDWILPAALYFWTTAFRQRVFVHTPCTEKRVQQDTDIGGSNTSLLEKLEPFGIRKEGLPESWGGTYRFNTAWVQDGEDGEDGEDEA